MGRERKKEKKGVINSALRSSAIMVPLFSHLKPTASGSEEIKSRPSHTHTMNMPTISQSHLQFSVKETTDGVLATYDSIVHEGILKMQRYQKCSID